MPTQYWDPNEVARIKENMNISLFYYPGTLTPVPQEETLIGILRKEIEINELDINFLVVLFDLVCERVKNSVEQFFDIFNLDDLSDEVKYQAIVNNLRNSFKIHRKLNIEKIHREANGYSEILVILETWYRTALLIEQSWDNIYQFVDRAESILVRFKQLLNKGIIE